jgi:hypothetical protein
MKKNQNKKRGTKRQKAQKSNFLIPAILIGIAIYAITKNKTSDSGLDTGMDTDTVQPPVNGPSVYKQLHKVNFGLN